jgi:hypothetical protein
MDAPPPGRQHVCASIRREGFSLLDSRGHGSRTMGSRTFMRMLSWRGAALLPLAALGVDRLRYLLAYGPNADQVFAAEGHGHMAWLVPVIAALALLALTAFGARLARAWRTGRADEGSRCSILALWVGCTGALLGAHLVQESLEWLLISGNDGFLALLGGGFLWALLAAAAVAGVLALLLRGARSLIRSAASRQLPGVRVAGAAPRVRRPRSLRRTLPAPLAGLAAGRAPPRAGALAA